MKFRTDFVTNSSSNCYLAFNIRNKRLYESLSELGIKFENVSEGELDDSMKIMLPSGRREIIDTRDNDRYPYVTHYPTVSEWFVAFLLWIAFTRPDWSDDDEDYDDGRAIAFAKELIKIFIEHGILHFDPNNTESWDEDILKADLHEYFGEMDGDLEYASIIHNFGGEEEIGPCAALCAEHGKRMSAEYYYPDWPARKSCEGVNFVIYGELNHYENREQIVEYIKGHGGTVTENITARTDYLICNDIDSVSLEMKMAKALGVPVLSEMAFINIFTDKDESEYESEDSDEFDD